MRKLSLDLNELAVESFDTATTGGRGTVRARAGSVYPECDTIYDYTCASCPQLATCGNTCRETCAAHCSWDTCTDDSLDPTGFCCTLPIPSCTWGLG